MRKRSHLIAVLLVAAAAWEVRADEGLERRVRELETRLARREKADLDEDIEGYLEHGAADAMHGGGRRVSLTGVVLAAGGASTAGNDELEVLQGGGHDPRRRGFTLQQVEIGLLAELSERVRAEAYTILVLDPRDGETRVELEEAFVVVGLGSGLELEAGHFFTEFGRRNPLHPHAWTFVDAPVVLTRFLGEDGMRAPGVRLGWRAGEWAVHLGLQNADGETMASFLGEDGGDVRGLDDLVALLRVERGAVGFSVATGPNPRPGTTTLLGVDAHLARGPYRFDAEAVLRRAGGDDDWGAWAQVVRDLGGSWRAGIRAGVFQGTGNDRVRVSALVAYEFEEGARVRLQVNAERDDALDGEFVSFWLVIEAALGRSGHAHGHAH